ncbi:MAG: hypothetical protein AAGK37_08090 [Pseudomonadota bacterium]
MERQVIEQRLTSYAHWYAASQGFVFGPGAKYDIEQMATDAVGNMFGQDMPTDLQPRHQAMIAQAEASLAMMVSTMIQGSEEISGYAARNPDTIGEETLAWARDRLCPLFPIC